MSEDRELRNQSPLRNIARDFTGPSRHHAESTGRFDAEIPFSVEYVFNILEDAGGAFK